MACAARAAGTPTLIPNEPILPTPRCFPIARIVCYYVTGQQLYMLLCLLDLFAARLIFHLLVLPRDIIFRLLVSPRDIKC